MPLTLPAALHPAHVIYQDILGPFGRRRLNAMLRSGLPGRLRGPLLYLLGGRLTPEEQRVAGEVEAIRREIAALNDVQMAVYTSPPPGAGPAPGPVQPITRRRVAEVASVEPYWGMFLHQCASAFEARTILELGSCAGISGCFLATASSCRRFITVERSESLAALAQANLRRVAPGRADVIIAFFDDALNQILPGLEEGLDLVYIDGQHEKASTLYYFERVIPRLNLGAAAVIFDDIHWSEDMTEAWRELRQRRGLACAINLGRFGLCVWAGGDGWPLQFDISRYTTRWGRGQR